jgi:hypothetical protein
MNCSNHEIEIFSSESSVNREVFRIYGSIKAPCDRDYVEIKTFEDSGDVKKEKVFSKKFKHLTRLKKDCENLIEIRYCRAKFTFKIENKTINHAQFDVQPLYIIPKNHDGRFQTTSDDVSNDIDDAKTKIDLAMELSQCIIGEKVNETMKSERNFVLRKCDVFLSEIKVKKALEMNQWELYDVIAAELVEKFDVNCRKFVGFVSCTSFSGLKEDEEYSYVNIKSKTKANPALGGGFLCLMGSGCFYSWPSHIDDVASAAASRKSVDISQVLDDSNYRKTFGGCFATTMGSLIHEIGHIFDLAHTETGLMGNDVDFIHRYILAENFTEILPKRNVRSCQLTQKGYTEKVVNSRLTKVRKPGGDFLEKYREQKDNDMTFFEVNCLVTLINHRWFTQSPPATFPIEFNQVSRTLTSSNPLRLVEIRDLPARNSMLIRFYTLMNENQREFVIPSNLNLKNVSLFAISSCGDIFKRDF